MSKEKIKSLVLNPLLVIPSLFGFVSVAVLLFAFIYANSLWQIEEAKAAGEVNIYYSVGQNTNDHKTGTSTITISGDTAVFSEPQTATNMGVGDQISYGDASATTTAYISSKVSSTTWNVITAIGGQPTATTTSEVLKIAHAFDSLNSAIGGTPGAANASHLGTSDLTSDMGYIMNIPCYYDSGPDTTAVAINGWTTATTTYIKIYTPVSTSTEVNLNQRHSGVWSDIKYNLVNADLTISANKNTKIDGLQFGLASPVRFTSSVVNSESELSNSIIKSNNISDGVNAIYIAPSGTGFIGKIWNNIIYDFATTTSNTRVIYGNSSNATTYFYNNTIIGGYSSVYRSSGVLIAKNNIAQDYGSGGFVGISGGSVNNIISAVSFIDKGDKNFHLNLSDSVAKNQGVDLSGDSYISFANDIDGNSRSGVWDCGADEVVGGPLISTSITSPESGTTILNTVSIDVSVSANNSVANVEFYLDGSLIGSDNSSPYSLSWNTANVDNSDYVLTAKAIDTLNNEATSSPINITISNPPPRVLYVREDGPVYGLGDGTSWINAYTGFDAINWSDISIRAGSIIYVSGGNYTSNIDPQKSGTNNARIIFKKATSVEHGTDTGWTADLATTTYFINGGKIAITQNYITVDGVYEYGLIALAPSRTCQYTGVSMSGSNNIVQYTYVDGNGDDWASSGYYLSGSDNSLKHVKTNDTCNDAVKISGSGHLIERSYIYGYAENRVANECCSGNVCHADGIENSGADNITIRYNNFSWTGDTIIFGINSGESDSWDIYGNVWHDGGTIMKIQSLDVPQTNIRVYNNSFVNYGSIITLTQEFDSKNNLFYNANMGTLDPNSNVTVSENPFVNSYIGDYGLVSTSTVINMGVDLGLNYMVDGLGSVRGYDGLWDIGAYEYVALSGTSTPIISSIASSTSATTATITWTTDQSASSTVYYGTTTAYGMSSTSDSLATSHSINISGLAEYTDYHFYIEVANASSTIATSSDYTFTTSDVTNPTVTGFDINATSSSLTVDINTFTGSDVGGSGVAGYLATTTSSTPDAGSSGWSSVVQTTYTFLTDGVKTLYGWVKDIAGNISASLSDTVTIDSTSPAISVVASSTTESTATVTWTTDENSNSLVQYGPTTSYGTASSSVTVVTSHVINLSSLSSGSSYNFRVISTDSYGNTSTSSDYTLTTIGVDSTAPVISNIATSTTNTVATITWDTDELATSTVYYGTTISYGTATSSDTLATSHNLAISSLSASTTYHFMIETTDQSGNTSTSSDMLLTTSSTCPIVQYTETYNAYPTCGPAVCQSGYHVSSNLCVVDTCATLTGATTYNAYPTCGATACASGYTISGSGSSATCVVQSSGGGGGGGGSSITVPKILELKTITNINQINILWTNPSTSYFSGAKIYRKEGSAPTSYNDSLAELVFTGAKASTTFMDINASTSTIYYYSVYGYYGSRYSQASTISASLTLATTTSINEEGETENQASSTEQKTNNNTSNTYGKYKTLASLSSTIVNLVSAEEVDKLIEKAKFVNLSDITVKVYTKIASLTERVLAELEKYNIASFIHYGTPTTEIIGAGERGGSIASFRSAFNRLPKTDTDWQDVIKIGNGRWPQQRSLEAENRAKIQFKKVYLREADMNQTNDNAAVTVMAYGLRPANRNLDSEKTAILTFRYVFKKDPSTASEWDVVRAIAYSGAKR